MSSEQPKKVTFRKSGKAHRGLIFPAQGDRREHLVAACSCPGSRRGYLTNGYVAIVCEGWEKANCKH